MGLLIMVVIITAICFIIFNIVKENSDAEICLAVLTGMGLVAILVLVIVAVMAGFANKATRHKYQATYNNLTARVERCDPSDTMLWHDVQEYNEKVVNGRYWRNSFWTNIYNEKCLLEFETIDISE